jgi:hypothetical protein
MSFNEPFAQMLKKYSSLFARASVLPFGFEFASLPSPLLSCLPMALTDSRRYFALKP